MNELYDFLNQSLDLKDNDNIIIGLSGGPDSMALVDIMHKYNKNLNIICAHVHHNLRKESDDEKIFVENYCKENNYVFEFYKIENYKNNKFSEEEARKIRYGFFESLINKYHAKYLFTAHHGDDLIETILMRLVRGSNFKGYSGINIISNKNNYQIVRPLLYLTKEDILNYLKENNISYVSDKSNESLKYTRNRYRINILPELKKENINVHNKFLKFSDMITKYDKFINDYVLKIYDSIVFNNKILINKFISEDEIIQRRIIEKYLYSIYGDDITLINDKHICDILGLIKNNKPNVKINLPNGYNAIKEYDILYISNCNLEDNYNYEVKDYIIIGDKTIKKVSACNLTDNNVIYLNSNDIKLPLYVRNYQTGDKILIKNMTNYKKIKDIFINEKVPASKRSSYPVLVDSNNEILWIPGLKKSHFDSQKTGKYDIILTYY
jgi:tRNA(Ile)-lysidine synthase